MQSPPLTTIAQQLTPGELVLGPEAGSYLCLPSILMVSFLWELHSLMTATISVGTALPPCTHAPRSKSFVCFNLLYTEPFYLRERIRLQRNIRKYCNICIFIILYHDTYFTEKIKYEAKSLWMFVRI